MNEDEGQLDWRAHKREQDAIERAKKEGKCISYIDDDGCEITATPDGHIFYNVMDWY